MALKYAFNDDIKDLFLINNSFVFLIIVSSTSISNLGLLELFLAKSLILSEKYFKSFSSNLSIFVKPSLIRLREFSFGVKFIIFLFNLTSQ